MQILLVACGGGEKAREAHIEGCIEGLGTDTLYLYGADALYDRVDTIPVVNDVFSTPLPAVDTLICAWLQLPDGREYPLFIGKGERIRVAGSAVDDQAVIDKLSAVDGPSAADSLSTLGEPNEADSLTVPGYLTSLRPLRLRVTGSLPNEELTAFYQSVDSLIEPTDSLLLAHAEAFIRSHPASLAGIAVLAQYFVEVPQPDVERIQSVASSMIGDIKDRPYVEDLLARFADDEKTKVGKSITSFSLVGPDGEEIGRTQYRERYILLHFWATFDSLSRADLATYRRVYRKEKSNKYVSLLGVSLDVDRAAWLAAIKADTLIWDQANDPAGWCAAIVSQMGLHSLPANVLLNAAGRVEARDLTEDELLDKIADITQKRQAQEQRKLKADQDRKARQSKKK